MREEQQRNERGTGRGRGKREEGTGKREEGRGKREEGKGKREKGRGRGQEVSNSPSSPKKGSHPRGQDRARSYVFPNLRGFPRKGIFRFPEGGRDLR
jgi:hypothetical protein